MSMVSVVLALIVLVGAVAWRPHGLGPAIGAGLAVSFALVGGAAELADVGTALAAQWRAYVTLAAVMTMTSAAERVGLLERLAARIEPQTRGPVRDAFRLTFILSAVVAAALSNDAAILVLTPTVLTLLRTVYPKRNPKFLVPFAVAVFAAAGVAPFVVSNPMNLIFADHMGIGFNRYSITMIPIAIAGWVTAYYVLVWVFREALADTSPALGAWPKLNPLAPGAYVVLAAVTISLLAYPILSYAGAPLWPIAGTGGVVCAITCLATGQRPSALARGVTWSIFPFLLGVFVIAIALGRVGVVAWLHDLYASASHPIATIGVTSALGSAVLNNHPMSVLNAFVLERGASDANAFAALIGGDLGPRLLPVGSLASLLWYDLLRKHDVTVKLTTFVRVGAILTVPTLTVSLLLLWLLRVLVG